MRAPIYRNLDKSVEILGLSPAQLVLVTIVLVGGGEIADFLGFSRLWSVGLAILLFLFLYMVRRRLGELFIKRVFRFISLPRFLNVKLISPAKIHNVSDDS